MCLSVRSDLEVPQYLDFVILCYLVGLMESDVICRFDLVVLAYVVVNCCCYVVISCLAQDSYYLGARTHYVGYCLILLFAHPAFWIISSMEYLCFVALGVQCYAFSHPSVGVLHWCDLRYLPFVLSMKLFASPFCCFLYFPFFHFFLFAFVSFDCLMFPDCFYQRSFSYALLMYSCNPAHWNLTVAVPLSILCRLHFLEGTTCECLLLGEVLCACSLSSLSFCLDPVFRSCSSLWLLLCRPRWSLALLMCWCLYFVFGIEAWFENLPAFSVGCCYFVFGIFLFVLHVLKYARIFVTCFDVGVHDFYYF